MTEKKWPVSAILIDLDGTLLDSAPDMIVAANAALTEAGVSNLSDDEIISMLGKGVRYLAISSMEKALGRKLDASEENAVVERFKKHYHQSNGRHTTVFEGVLAGLKAFKEAGFKLACVTNKIAEFTEPLLERCGISVYLDLIVSGDTTDRQKPDPEPVWYAMKMLGAEKAVMIGDSVNDIQAAKNANIPAICVTYGYGGKPAVEADAYVADFLAVLPLVERI